MTTDVELAHDLRMPLQIIYSSAQMLRLSARDGTLDAGAYLDTLMESVEQLRAGGGEPRALIETDDAA